MFSLCWWTVRSSSMPEFILVCSMSSAEGEKKNGCLTSAIWPHISRDKADGRWFTFYKRNRKKNGKLVTRWWFILKKKLIVIKNKNFICTTWSLALIKANLFFCLVFLRHRTAEEGGLRNIVFNLNVLVLSWNLISFDFNNAICTSVRQPFQRHVVEKEVRCRHSFVSWCDSLLLAEYPPYTTCLLGLKINPAELSLSVIQLLSVELLAAFF